MRLDRFGFFGIMALVTATSAGRRHIMLGTAGHVDHGKTALVKLLTGCETDTLAEEKQRGLTIDLGFAPCRLADDRIVGIVDVPGHVDFIRNMAAGAQGIDVVILVVAADDGIMPQTREHLHILTLMGLRHGLVALTKSDLVDATRLEQVTAELRSLLAGTFLQDSSICPVSNITGSGFDAFFDALNEAVSRCEDRPASGVFRLWVEDVFPIKGAGTVITGVPSRGRVRVGDTLLLQPAGLSARVRRLQVYGQEAPEARAGECVALNLPEIDHEKARRGMLLTAEALGTSALVEAEFRALQTLKGAVPDLLECQVHVGTAAVGGHVALLGAFEIGAGTSSSPDAEAGEAAAKGETGTRTSPPLDAGEAEGGAKGETGRRTSPPLDLSPPLGCGVLESAPGQCQLVQLRLVQPLPLLPGECYVLRANLPGQGQTGLVTIGGGRILALSDRKLRRKKRWTLDWLSARREALDDPLRWCEQMLLEAQGPATVRSLAAQCGALPAEVLERLERLCAQRSAIELTTKDWVHARVLQGAADALVSSLDQFHAANPQRHGMAREELLSAARVLPGVFDAAMQAAIDSGRVQRSGSVFARAGWQPRLSAPEDALTARVAAEFLQAGFAGPSPAELALRLNVPNQRVEKALRLLVERAELIRLDERTWIHKAALTAAQATAVELFRRQSKFSTMEFRDALGVSRKYAVPILDCLDRLRFTVRSGHDRTPGVEARKLLVAA